MAGWIKISRDIQSHWIYQDSEKLKWWIDLLLLANFEDKKVTIKFRVFDCKRGQLLYSLKTLSQRWNVSKSVVNNFLEMLRKQNMIETVNETVTTRITICNYDTYQQIGNANETETKRNQNANETQCDTTKEHKEQEVIKEIKKKTKDVEFDFSFVANNFKEPFEMWIDYKKQIKDPYKTQIGIEKAYSNLLLLSTGKPNIAQLIVDKSIANNWKGLFEYKGKVEESKSVVSEMTDKEFKKYVWENYIITMNDVDFFSVAQLKQFINEGKYQKK